jgi:hypothetical protein
LSHVFNRAVLNCIVEWKVFRRIGNFLRWISGC